MPVLSEQSLTLTPQFLSVLVEIRYRALFSSPERQMALAGAKITGGLRWRDEFHLYGIDASQRTLLVHLNGGFIPLTEGSPNLGQSIVMERSFTLSRASLNEDFFGADEIRCEIKVFPQMSVGELTSTLFTATVSLPGGFPQ